MRTHPPDAWLRETLKRKGTDRILEHIDQCARCKERLAVFATAERFERSAEKIDYGPAIERSYRIFEERQAALARERNDAPKLLARLLNLTPERQQLLLRNSRRFQTWGLLELLLQYGEQETFVNPVHAEEIFRLALDVSTYLDSSLYGKERVEDIRARAWGVIGNARRARMDLPTSEEAFGEAFLRLQKGTDDIMERTLLLYLQISLLRAQRSCEEAVRISHRVISTYKRAGEHHQAGRTLVKLSTVYHVMGNIKDQLLSIHKAFDLFDPIQEPRLALCALHNAAEGLAEIGNFKKARKIITRARPLYQRFPEPQYQNRRLWVEARIASGLGHHRDAEALLLIAREGFVSIGSNFESDLISRELIALRTRPGTTF